MVDVAREPRARITIVKDAAAGTKIMRTIFLAATMRKDSRSIR
jgi:hypothetical protein